MNTQIKQKDVSFFEEKEHVNLQPSTVKIKTSELMNIHSSDRTCIVFFIIFFSIFSYNTLINLEKGFIDAVLSIPLISSLFVSAVTAFFSNLVFSQIFKGDKKLTLITQTREEIQCLTNIQDFRLKTKKLISFINNEAVIYKKNYNSNEMNNSVCSGNVDEILGNNISRIEDICVFAESLLNPAFNIEAISSLSEEKIIEHRTNIILIINENYFNKELLGTQMRKIISATNLFSQTT